MSQSRVRKHEGIEEPQSDLRNGQTDVLSLRLQDLRKQEKPSSTPRKILQRSNFCGQKRSHQKHHDSMSLL
jgi:hypothetical protein